MKRILSIDGGGIRGIVPCVLLMEIEKRTQQPIWKLFDLIAGTSTGGILAAILTRPVQSGGAMYTAADVLDLYFKYGKVIFDRSWLGNVFDHFAILQKQYPASGVEGVLKTYLGTDAMISGTLTDILVTAYDFEQNRPAMFKTSDARADHSRDVALWYAARCTSAAPKYFPAKDQYWDGGLFANNPAMCAYCESKSMWPDEDVFLLSLGTGHRTDHYKREDLQDAGIAKILVPVVECLQEGSYDDVDFQLRALLPKSSRYIRFSAELPTDIKSGMDCVDPENLQDLQQFGESLIATNSDLMQETLKILASA